MGLIEDYIRANILSGSNGSFNDRFIALLARTFLIEGSPEGVIAAPVGAIASRADGTPGATLYVKEAGGGGDTGWTAIGGGGGGGVTLQGNIFYADTASLYDVSLTDAAGDGVTDDWAALDDLSEFISAEGGGWLVLTPGKTYGILGPGGSTSPHGIRLRDNVRIWGYGATIKALGNADLNPGMIAHKDYDYTADRVSVTGTTVKDAGVFGVTLNGNFSGGHTSGVVGIRIDGFERLSIVDVTVTDTNSYGIAFQARADGTDGNLPQEDLIFHNVRMLSVGQGVTPRDGVDAKSGRRWHISDCVIDTAGDSGFNLRIEDCHIRDCRTIDCNAGFRFQRVGNGFGGGTSGTVSIYGRGLKAIDCATGFDLHGIQAGSGHDPTDEEVIINLTDCSALRSTTTGMMVSTGENLDLIVDGFSALDGSSRGIDFAVATAGQQCRVGRFQHVICRNNTSDGVRTAGGNTFWEYCDFIDNGGSGFNETGTRTNFPNSAIDNVVDTETCKSGVVYGNTSADVAPGNVVSSAGTIWMPKGSPFGKRMARIDGTTNVGTINGVAPGERVHIWANGAWTLVQSSTIKLNGGVNFAMAAHYQVGLLKTNTDFKEIYRATPS